MHRPNVVHYGFFTFCVAWLLQAFDVITQALSTLVQTVAYRHVTEHTGIQEPPVLKSRIPLVGHFLHILFDGSAYLRRLGQESDLPVFTLPIMGRRFYVAASPTMVHAVQKSHKALSFNTIINQAFERVCLFDEDAMAIVKQGNAVQVEDGDVRRKTNTMQKIRGSMVKHLRPGNGLDIMTSRFLDSLMHGPNVPTNEDGSGKKVLLWETVRHSFCLATANAFWGLEHPFRDDPALYSKALAEFEAGVLSLFAVPFPALTAPRAHTARSELLKALKEYTDRDGFNQSAAFIKSQYEATRGVGDTLMANGGLGLAFSAMGPITTQAFWMICWIFARPSLLAEVRAEVDGCLSMRQEGGELYERRTCDIDTARLTTDCPLLFACLAETLRLTSTQLTFRLAQEDTHVTDPSTGQTHLFREGGVILMVSSGMLDRKDLWGEDTSVFDPQRFIAGHTSTPAERCDIADPPRLSEGQRAAFAPFGSGVHLCPGRFFAQKSILSFAAQYIAGFELTASGGGSLNPPEMSKKLSVSNGKPANDLEVLVSRRTGFEDCDWRFV